MLSIVRDDKRNSTITYFLVLIILIIIKKMIDLEFDAMDLS